MRTLKGDQFLLQIHYATCEIVFVIQLHVDTYVKKSAGSGD